MAERFDSAEADGRWWRTWQDMPRTNTPVQVVARNKDLAEAMGELTDADRDTFASPHDRRETR